MSSKKRRVIESVANRGRAPGRSAATQNADELQLRGARGRRSNRTQTTQHQHDLQPEAVEEFDVDEDGPAEAEDMNTLYCFCRTHYNENDPMLACDKCDTWYHNRCVGIDTDMAKKIDFTCLPCSRNMTLEAYLQQQQQQQQQQQHRNQPLHKLQSDAASGVRGNRAGPMNNAMMAGLALKHSMPVDPSQLAMQGMNMNPNMNLGMNAMDAMNLGMNLNLANMDAMNMNLDMLGGHGVDADLRRHHAAEGLGNESFLNNINFQNSFQHDMGMDLSNFNPKTLPPGFDVNSVDLLLRRQNQAAAAGFHDQGTLGMGHPMFNPAMMVANRHAAMGLYGYGFDPTGLQHGQMDETQSFEYFSQNTSHGHGFSQTGPGGAGQHSGKLSNANAGFHAASEVLMAGPVNNRVKLSRPKATAPVAFPEGTTDFVATYTLSVADVEHLLCPSESDDDVFSSDADGDDDEDFESQDEEMESSGANKPLTTKFGSKRPNKSGPEHENEKEREKDKEKDSSAELDKNFHRDRSERHREREKEKEALHSGAGSKSTTRTTSGANGTANTNTNSSSTTTTTTATGPNTSSKPSTSTSTSRSKKRPIYISPTEDFFYNDEVVHIPATATKGATVIIESVDAPGGVSSYHVQSEATTDDPIVSLYRRSRAKMRGCLGTLKSFLSIVAEGDVQVDNDFLQALLEVFSHNPASFASLRKLKLTDTDKDVEKDKEKESEKENDPNTITMTDAAATTVTTAPTPVEQEDKDKDKEFGRKNEISLEEKFFSTVARPLMTKLYTLQKQVKLQLHEKLKASRAAKTTKWKQTSKSLPSAVSSDTKDENEMTTNENETATKAIGDGITDIEGSVEVPTLEDAAPMTDDVLTNEEHQNENKETDTVSGKSPICSERCSDPCLLHISMDQAKSTFEAFNTEVLVSQAMNKELTKIQNQYTEYLIELFAIDKPRFAGVAQSLELLRTLLLLDETSFGQINGDFWPDELTLTPSPAPSHSPSPSREGKDGNEKKDAIQSGTDSTSVDTAGNDTETIEHPETQKSHVNPKNSKNKSNRTRPGQGQGQRMKGRMKSPLDISRPLRSLREIHRELAALACLPFVDLLHEVQVPSGTIDLLYRKHLTEQKSRAEASLIHLQKCTTLMLSGKAFARRISLFRSLVSHPNHASESLMFQGLQSTAHGSIVYYLPRRDSLTATKASSKAHSLYTYRGLRVPPGQDGAREPDGSGSDLDGDGDADVDVDLDGSIAHKRISSKSSDTGVGVDVDVDIKPSTNTSGAAATSGSVSSGEAASTTASTSTSTASQLALRHSRISSLIREEKTVAVSSTSLTGYLPSREFAYPVEKILDVSESESLRDRLWSDVFTCAGCDGFIPSSSVAEHAYYCRLYNVGRQSTSNPSAASAGAAASSTALSGWRLPTSIHVSQILSHVNGAAGFASDGARLNSKAAQEFGSGIGSHSMGAPGLCLGLGLSLQPTSNSLGGPGSLDQAGSTHAVPDDTPLSICGFPYDLGVDAESAKDSTKNSDRPFAFCHHARDQCDEHAFWDILLDTQIATLQYLQTFRIRSLESEIVLVNERLKSRIQHEIDVYDSLVSLPALIDPSLNPKNPFLGADPAHNRGQPPTKRTKTTNNAIGAPRSQFLDPIRPKPMPLMPALSSLSHSSNSKDVLADNRRTALRKQLEEIDKLTPQSIQPTLGIGLGLNSENVGFSNSILQNMKFRENVRVQTRQHLEKQAALALSDKAEPLVSLTDEERELDKLTKEISEEFVQFQYLLKEHTAINMAQINTILATHRENYNLFRLTPEQEREYELEQQLKLQQQLREQEQEQEQEQLQMQLQMQMQMQMQMHLADQASSSVDKAESQSVNQNFQPDGHSVADSLRTTTTYPTGTYSERAVAERVASQDTSHTTTVEPHDEALEEQRVLDLVFSTLFSEAHLITSKFILSQEIAKQLMPEIFLNTKEQPFEIIWESFICSPEGLSQLQFLVQAFLTRHGLYRALTEEGQFLLHQVSQQYNINIYKYFAMKLPNDNEMALMADDFHAKQVANAVKSKPVSLADGLVAEQQQQQLLQLQLQAHQQNQQNANATQTEHMDQATAIHHAHHTIASLDGDSNAISRENQLLNDVIQKIQLNIAALQQKPNMEEKIEQIKQLCERNPIQAFHYAETLVHKEYIKASIAQFVRSDTVQHSTADILNVVEEFKDTGKSLEEFAQLIQATAKLTDEAKMVFIQIAQLYYQRLSEV